MRGIITLVPAIVLFLISLFLLRTMCRKFLNETHEYQKNLEFNYWVQVFKQIADDRVDYVSDDVDIKVEEIDLYAWKLFLVEKVKADSDFRYELRPIHQKGSYNIIEPNNYLAIKNDPFDLTWKYIPEDYQALKQQYPPFVPMTLDKCMKESLDARTRIYYARGTAVKHKEQEAIRQKAFDHLVTINYFAPRYIRHSFGFYSWKNPQDAMPDVYAAKPCILAKIKIWGDIIEAEKGYQSENFQLQELYTFTSADSVDDRINNLYVSESDLEKAQIKINYLDGGSHSLQNAPELQGALSAISGMIKSTIVRSAKLCDTAEFSDTVFPITVHPLNTLLQEGKDFSILRLRK